MRIFLTGAAGFIGFHTSTALLKEGHEVHGFDNLNDYYDPKYKIARLNVLNNYENFSFTKGDISKEQELKEAFKRFKPDHVLHLAAQAGVRYSIENPNAYIEANIIGFQNVVELVRAQKPKNFVYASSSSVYGGIKSLPFSEEMNVSSPVSLYAATKISNELVAKSYSHLYDIPSVGLRFFTVYGTYSRPDMAMYKFAELMFKGSKIPVFNSGNMDRDFTYIDDIVKGIISSLKKPESAQIYNFGRGSQMNLMEMISLLEKNLNIEAKKEMLPMQPGDVPATLSDISKARKNLGYNPTVDLAEGISKFSIWFKEHIKEPS